MSSDAGSCCCGRNARSGWRLRLIVVKMVRWVQPRRAARPAVVSRKMMCWRTLVTQRTCSCRDTVLCGVRGSPWTRNGGDSLAARRLTVPCSAHSLQNKLQNRRLRWSLGTSGARSPRQCPKFRPTVPQGPTSATNRTPRQQLRVRAPACPPRQRCRRISSKPRSSVNEVRPLFRRARKIRAHIWPTFCPTPQARERRCM
mmetsp:Transcript_41844/g.110836  ORF Transcript_41844/g.110836 Transcript_41844/m.110836 type:complete len:200 (+) Transcript_41844:391-990(+)